MKLAKIISFILVLSMCFSLAAPAIAVEPSTNIAVLQNDRQTRSVESIVDGIRITATYDKLNCTLTLEYVDVETDEIISYVVCDMIASTVTAEGKTYQVYDEATPFVYNNNSKSTESGFSYNYRNDQSCFLSRPQKVSADVSRATSVFSFTTVRRTSNQVALQMFKEKVDDIASNEGDLKRLYGSKVIADVFAAVFISITATVNIRFFISALTSSLDAINANLDYTAAVDGLSVNMTDAYVWYRMVQDDYVDHLSVNPTI